MYTIFRIYFENIEYYFTEFSMVQKLKYTNKIGFHLDNFLDKIKSEQQYGKIKEYTLYNLIIFAHFIHLRRVINVIDV